MYPCYRVSTADLIWGVHPGSGGQGGLGARGGGAARRSSAPRRRSTGESHPGIPMADSGHGLALEHARGMRKSQVGSDRRCGARTRLATARGGVSGSGATPSIVLASESAYGPLQLAHKDREGSGVLTEAWKRVMWPCRGVDVRVRRRRARRSLGRWRCRGPRDSWAPRIDARGSCEDATGVRGAQGSPAARKSRQHKNLHLRVVRRNSGDAKG